MDQSLIFLPIAAQQDKAGPLTLVSALRRTADFLLPCALCLKRAHLTVSRQIGETLQPLDIPDQIQLSVCTSIDPPKDKPFSHKATPVNCSSEQIQQQAVRLCDQERQARGCRLTAGHPKRSFVADRLLGKAIVSALGAAFQHSEGDLRPGSASRPVTARPSRPISGGEGSRLCGSLPQG